MVVYPSNNGQEPEPQAAKVPEQPAKKEPIVKGKVKVKKKGALSKFADIFLPEDRASVGDYILRDVIVPYVLKIADDAFHMFLYGKTGDRSDRSGSTFYSSISSGEVRRSEPLHKKSHFVDEIVFDSRPDAELVLQKLREDITKYKLVTVLALCEYADVPFDWTYDKYGWTDLRTASVVRVRDGYAIQFPNPIPID